MSASLFVILHLLTPITACTTRQVTDTWSPYEKGFVELSGQGRGGGKAFYCENSKPDESRGAQKILALNQTVAHGFLVTAWSKSEGVNGSADDGYSLYLDLAYMDGGHLWGTFASFTGGTHDWEQRKVRILPIKPIKSASVYLLFRRHTGKAWFSDVSVSELGGKGSFDYQKLTPPVVRGEGWFVRDVAKGSELTPASEGSKLGLKIDTSAAGESRKIQVRDRKGIDRALTLYYCEKVDAVGGRWWNTIRSSVPIGADECATLTNAPSGANGLTSLYPFAAVTTQSMGKMLAVPPTIGPRPVRLFYNPGSKLLCASFDVALTALNRRHPSETSAEIVSKSIDPAWGFRDAARQYYALYPEAYRNRIAKQGIWIPFTNPSSIQHPEDFGISVHEGDNSVAADDKLGVLSFRYTEPMTWWMNMAPAIPRTYQDALKILDQNLSSPDAPTRKQAEAVISSGTFGPDGRYNVSFQNQPWANGAVWILNPNPAMPRVGGKAIQADTLFDLNEAAKRYSSTKLSGEYLDSLEAHAEVVDYRKESLASSSLAPSFDEESKRPVIPQAFSTYEISKLMSTWLHDRGKLLMANTTPVSYFAYMPLMDCAGIEVNWLSDGAWTPDGDDVFCYRRTLAYRKPYMLLQNTDYSKFGSKQVELYFDKCLFYGVFPSFFSADAATNPYWEDPKLYNRDRALFKSTIPLIQSLAGLGWEPVTKARTSDSSIFVERYGDHTWTLFNDGETSRSFTVLFDNAGAYSNALELRSGDRLPLEQGSGKKRIELSLEPGRCKVIQLH